ncbi:hypothetical protein SNE40_017946 [Patella caerulea]|uniref:Uncharacterized protein n=1 Tax=Patella caerulea TaxID=87958 RepID=A0AAN8JBD7_PATCE
MNTIISIAFCLALATVALGGNPILGGFGMLYSPYMYTAPYMVGGLYNPYMMGGLYNPYIMGGLYSGLYNPYMMGGLIAGK